jgi:membrane protein YfhO
VTVTASRRTAPTVPIAPRRRLLGFSVAQHLVAVALFAAVTLWFFFPVVRGDTFSDVAGHQQQLAPWEKGAPLERSFPVLHFDQAETFYPWQVFMNRALRDGELPLWNPYSFGGTPFFANGQSDVLYPPRVVLAYTVAPTRVHDLLLATHVFAAGVAMFLLLGFAGISFPSAVIGGLAWMLNSFGLAWLALEHYVVLGVWLPVAVLLVQVAVKRRSWAAALWLAVVAACMSVGGNPLFVELGLAAVFGYGVGLALTEGRHRRALGGNALRLAAAGALFVGLSAVTLLPTAVVTNESARASLSYGQLADFALPWQALQHIFVRPPKTLYFFDPYHQALFAGTAVGVLAIVGLLSRAALARFAAVLGVLTILFMVHTPVTFVVAHVLPGLASFKPLARAAFLLEFSLAVLAAYGLDQVNRRLRRYTLPSLPGPPLRVGALLGLVARAGSRADGRLAAGALMGVVGGGLIVRYGRDHLDWTLAAAIALASPPAAALAFELGAGQGGRRAARSALVAGSLCAAAAAVVVVRSLPSLLVLLAAVLGVLATVRLTGRLASSRLSRGMTVAAGPRVAARSSALAIFLAAAVGASIVWQLHSWADDVLLHQPNADPYLYPRTPLIRHLEERRESRFLPVGGAFSGSTAMIYPLQSAGGYESLLPGRVQNLWRVVGNGIPPSKLASLPLIYAYHPVFGLGSQKPALLARAGVDSVVAPPRERGERRPTGLAPAWIGRDGRVFPVPDAVPRAYVVGACEEAGTPLAALSRLVAPKFDPGAAVILERSFLRREKLSCAGGVREAVGSAEIVKRSLNSLLVRIDARRSGWLVVAESWDRGWRASVDGRRTDVLPGNYAFRAVRVPAGKHDVELVYRPALFEVGAAISIASLGVTIGALVLLPLLRRRRACR